MTHAKRWIELSLFLTGVAFFAGIIASVEPARLQVIFPALSGTGWLVFALYPGMCVWDVGAWKILFIPPWQAKLGFFEAFWIRMAGEAVNNITPILDVGGEPLKIILVSRRFGVPKATALAAGVLGRTALFTAETVFIMAGLGLSFFFLPLPAEWKWVCLTALITFILILLFLVIAQQKGIFVTLIRWLHLFGIDKNIFDRFQVPFEKVDQEISVFYRQEKRKFGTAVFLHTLGWLAGGVEMMVMFRIIGVPISLLEGIILESLLQLVRCVSFFIPGNLGAQEGGLALFIQLLGYHPALGVAVSLLKRTRQIIWTAIGFGVWGIYQTKFIKIR